MNILGVKIDNLSHKEILDKISGFLNDVKFHQIATVGPEFILEAAKNVKYKDILNNCDLNVADGFGIKCAFWRYGKKLKTRMAGVNLMQEILKMAEDRGLGVFLACRKDGLSSWEETKEAILKICPKLNINGKDIDLAVCHSEPRRGGEESNKINYRIRSFGFAQDDKYNIKKFNIIFSNFGAPQQEIFLNSLKNDIIGVAMGVGGSFDFITGKIKRAPRFLRQIGLEWLWRLIQQPWEQKGKRLKRIWNAVAVFPIKVLFNKQ